MWGDVFTKNLKFKKSYFIVLHLNFSCYYCSIDLKRQSEHSRLKLDTSSLVFIVVLLTEALFLRVKVIFWRLKFSRGSTFAADIGQAEADMKREVK